MFLMIFIIKKNEKGDIDKRIWYYTQLVQYHFFLPCTFLC